MRGIADLLGRGGNLPLGARGEREAERWLRTRGYRILARNLQSVSDEIDLLALDPDGETLVVVEVKTRGDTAHGLPEEQVGFRKQKRLARIASRLQQTRRYRGKPLRFDVVAIIWPDGEEAKVKHIPSAFESPI